MPRSCDAGVRPNTTVRKRGRRKQSLRLLSFSLCSWFDWGKTGAIKKFEQDFLWHLTSSSFQLCKIGPAISCSVLFKRMDDQSLSQAYTAHFLPGPFVTIGENLYMVEELADSSTEEQHEEGKQYNHPAEKTLGTKQIKEEETTLVPNLSGVNEVTKNQFDCAECGMVFSLRSQLTRHENQHTKPHLCEECGRGFARRQQLVTHMRTHTGQKPYMCDECGQSFTQSSNLRTHKMKHNIIEQRTDAGQKEYQCKICYQVFGRKAEILCHQRSATDELHQTQRCTVCSLEFSSISALQEHKLVHSKKRIKCPHCPKEFRKYSKLTIHLRSHTGEKPFKCEFCDKAFAVNFSLKAHERQHTDDKPYTCDICMEGFPNNDQFRVHMNFHTGNVFKCEVCEKVFPFESRLLKHVRVHTGEKLFTCEECGKKFTFSSNYQRHIRVHQNTRRHHCDTCKKSFATSGRLTEHIRIHTGERPFKCEYCKKTFIQNMALTIHRRIHSGEKPYQCDACQKKFRSSSALSSHRTRWKCVKTPVEQTEPEDLSMDRDSKSNE